MTHMLTAAQMVCLLGKASYQWDTELGLHVPTCSGYKLDGMRVVRCGNGPLSEPELAEGLCAEGPHLEPTSLPRNLAEALRERARDGIRER